MTALKIVAVIVVCYLIGNINFALIISKFKKKDVRNLDSGNPGAMNMARNFGVKIGFLTLGLDSLKGVAATLIGWLVIGEFMSLHGTDIGAYIGGISAIVGHIFPVFLRFKGGKGISTTVGMGFVLCPIVAPISLFSAIVYILITKMGAAASFIAITPWLAYCTVEVMDYPLHQRIVIQLIMLAIYLLALIKHRKNIKKMFLGTENKTNAFKKKA